ncbi:hypothetical protein M404DRAFT_31824 [Pisolithus tinctorius Marx 270]|uniref:Uncharacterized protein n=1 Tax=Pisolithus tinctorius Marx 270 TaxID=870435 RepID=A0A0C3JJY3_PISTI|nr:hypothetical protein M404DRAFT_31824 [Pisolithus tinctorius Marx 270]
MSPLRPRIQRSACLQAISGQPMASSSEQAHRGGSNRPTGNSGSGRGLSGRSTHGGTKGKNPASSSQRAVTTTGDTSTTEGLQLKNINWDVPRTDILINWLLTHPANRRILFSDKITTVSPPSPDEGPVGHNKKEVQAIIAEVVFKNDPYYKDMYMVGPAKFQVSVGNCITMLKGSYCKCRARFKQSGEGIMPGHASYANLHSVLNTLPWYDDLHSIWQGNPSFDSDLINSEPDKNRAEDFLAIVQNKSSGTPSNTGTEEMRGDQDLEDGEVDERMSHVGDLVVNEGDEFADSIFDLEGTDPGFGDGEDVNMDSVSVHGDQSYPQPLTPEVQSQFSLPRKSCTPFSDNHSAFHQSPYLRPPTSTRSVISSTSSSSSSSRKGKAVARTPWSSSSKTTSTEASSLPVAHNKSQLQSQVIDMSQEAESILASSSSGKTVWYLAKMQYMLKDWELELRKEQLRMQWKDVEDKHQREQELRKLDIELKNAEENAFMREAETLRLKIQLAELMKSGASSGSTSSDPTA